MPREPQDVTEAELSLMRRLWEMRRASIRQLTDNGGFDGFPDWGSN